ncbi:hypothetical protein [Nocardia gipuzkoensis]|uniref:hypothetical protein n=1 Tax=Nocardia gipuzkoensis TaxID=2749991 RepID=UPI00237E8EEA|nr:hypothetical protein [Nocardia gipuzkoensis]MDE1673792.1 hypothetical protein [Nocardia gipuzkoensis]
MATECTYTLHTYTLFGRDRYNASCETCDVPCSGWTETAAVANFEAHKAIPAPPADVLAQPLTPATIQQWPEYFIRGRGRPIAARTDCGHGYPLTARCHGCDHDEDQAR